MAVNPTRRGGYDAQSSTRFDVETFLDRWGNAFLATARRYSPAAVDADDAYQRAVIALLTKRPDLDDETQLVAWMQTVTRNEALQMHRANRNIVDVEFDKLSESLVADVPLPDDELVASEELSWGREALARIRPDQTRCLLLKAEGLANPEICEATGFSYAKVNRLLSEGRKALGTQITSIAGGRECQRIEPLLLLVADGTADLAVRDDTQLHLKHCAACRATLRDLHAVPESLAAIFPLGGALVIVKASPWARMLDQLQSWIASLQERVFGHVANQSEVITAKKIVAVTSIAAAVVGGGVVAKKSIDSNAQPAAKSPAASAAALVNEIKVPPVKRVNPRVARAKREAAAERRQSRETAIQSNENVDSARGIAAGAETDAISGDANDVAPAGAGDDAGQDVGALAP